MEDQGFWEDPERVERFAGRSPDHRLMELIQRYVDAGATCVLDLGCAGGRNAVVLAEHGFDVRALDASRAMVEHTRSRLAELVGVEAARTRVQRGRMDALPYESQAFDLVVSLGVMHSARSRAEWDRAADETARVLRPGGRLLFNQFTPRTDLTGQGLRPAGAPDLYDGLPGGRAVLLEAEALDAAWAERGLSPEVPSETVQVAKGDEVRVSVNALYRRRLMADG
jgi:SAM-dependent methyltransferase